ncbi:1-aminocyclopropane-1-carboxylate deaminase/D-cysteine desulfhydrase [Mucilaginibacter gilvus]|uniref:Pyridoxal-phosphate dependent enzyme n=1 Tax=Mucilaginibacter gilvus TaxID=2305909 RepID=A0A3S4YAU7_9SPHI|nr:pyridoxal-phosphate dependent enzyme [Mucilaginibacter gilvus]RWY51112.1 pyridoxal-phosphate dependent enzyme [Mucilaginibacter gilvus]
MSIHLDIYSPIQQIHDELFAAKGIEVFIKRDDMIHPLISGNKWRKLKYILQKARDEAKTQLVTFGGAYSNHLLATAAVAAKFGFNSTGFVRGEEVQNDTLFMCRLHGMQIIFTDRDSYRDKPALFTQYFGGDINAFFIDEGGASTEAAKGCSELIGELTEPYQHIFCACGTGTTAAGLINGIVQHHLNTRFNAISVFKNGGFIKVEIDKYLSSPVDYDLHLHYHFCGYAKTTPDLIGFIKQFVGKTGILIEPVYTAKMMYAIYDLAAKDHFQPGSRILAIHTGGLLGLLGMREKF